MLKIQQSSLGESKKDFLENRDNNNLKGYLKKFKKHIAIYDSTHTKVGIINAHGVLASATKLDNGKWWYNFATITEIGLKSDYSYQKEIQEIQTICNHLNFQLL
ncbi:hypothetical protein [Halobacteriovorax sp. ZH2_bin.1]|uniref:hypothetical protein n=1 Tax=Halobacteriovorax sp. ZH2_bin.1 TaxID=3157724 RepID=UPI00371460E2